MLSPRPRLVVGVILLVSLAPASPRARAGGFTLTTFGGRRGGMQAVVACPDDLTALFHNPAGLADQPDVQLYVYASPTFVSHDFRMQALDAQRYPAINPAGCGATPEAAPCPWPVDADGYYARAIEPERYFGVLPFAAASTDLGWIGRRGRDVVVAAAVFAPNLYGAYLPESAPTAYNIIGGMFLVLSPTVGVAWRPSRIFALGASLSYNHMRLSMSQKLSTVDALTPRDEEPSGIGRFAQSLIGDLRLDFDGVDHGVGWNIGALVNPLPWLAVGLGYAGATNARFEGPISFRALGEMVRDQETFEQLVRSVGYKLPERLIIEQPIPHGVHFGLHFVLPRFVELGLEGRLWFYQLFETQRIAPIYDPDAPGAEPMTEASLSRDKHYRMSFQISGGVAARPFARLRGLELMAGAGYDHSPIPDETFSLDNPSNSYVKLTVGARWSIDRRWRVSASYLLGLYLPRDVRNSQTHPPMNVQGAGITHSPGIDVTYAFR